MANVTPPLELFRPTTPGEYAEFEIISLLANGLGDAFEVFRGVDWTVADPRFDHHGEFDVVVVNLAGDIVVLEVKAGRLTSEEGTLFKSYGKELKDVRRQSDRQFHAIQRRISEAHLRVRLQHVLVLPQQRLDDLGTVSFPRERIADATDCQDISGVVLRCLGSGLSDPDSKGRVCAFLGNQLRHQPDVSSLSRALRRRVSELSGGLATWVPRMWVPSGIIRVVGTAGSGKTQLALTQLRQARIDGRTAAYVCFNRSLADRMRVHAPAGIQVGSFHQLSWQAAGRSPGVPDFDDLARRYDEVLSSSAPDLDLLIIDEMQDMQADWVQALIQRVKAEGRLLLLDDPGQNLYSDRVELDLPDAAIVTCDDNHRSPHQIVATINALKLTGRTIKACGPFAGEAPNILGYQPPGQGDGSDHLMEQTQQAVRNCLGLGYALGDIVILTWRGVEHSALHAMPQLGGWKLSKFTGQYDAAGEPISSEGQLRLETVRRFKGQSAPAIVLTEVDFNEMDDVKRRMLFVALTRAEMHVELVVSDAAQAAIARGSNS